MKRHVQLEMIFICNMPIEKEYFSAGAGVMQGGRATWFSRVGQGT
jgi:hypothetical protein